MSKNRLYWGNNLDVLRDRDQFPNDFVDLIYLDPPFNSKRDFNAFFKERSGARSEARVRAFEDTWRWGQAAAGAYNDVVANGPERLQQTMKALRKIMPRSDMLAYLSMMAQRLAELHRTLKPSGTLYLHCDPTASHHLKLLLDSIFTPKRFLNEIIWKRSSAHSDTKQGMRRPGKIHDTILVYTKSGDYAWNPLYTPYTAEYLRSEFKRVDQDGRRYAESNPTAAKPGGDTEYLWRVKRNAGVGARWEADLDDEYLDPREDSEYKGVPPYRGRYWAFSKARMIQFARDGMLHHRETGVPRIRLYADRMPGIPLQDIWDDIPPELGKRSLGYPTQKPEALLDRIIQSSSNRGDLVLDPFCGCGTAIASAQKLGRRWIGIDATPLAIGLIKYRFQRDFRSPVSYEVVGEPTDYEGAVALANHDRFQFQCWAVAKLAGRPVESRKGKDRGIDGRLPLYEGEEERDVIFSVKSGKPRVGELRDLIGVMGREDARIGVMITLEEPTKAMIEEASDAESFTSRFAPGKKYPSVQIITVKDLLAGKRIDCPPWSIQPIVDMTPKSRRKKDRPDDSLLPLKGFSDEPTLDPDS